MLVLSRRKGESIRIGRDITVMVVHAGDNAVRLGITAPRSLPVHREEVADRLDPPLPDHKTGDPAYFCDQAVNLIGQVLNAKQFVGPLCRERLTIALDKLAALKDSLSVIS